jgi:hypothetical protein
MIDLDHGSRRLGARVPSILTLDRDGGAFIRTSLASHETSRIAIFLVWSGQS